MASMPPFDAVSALEVLRARYAGQLPASLDDLAGPVRGRVDLPLHVVWSGVRSFDLDRPRLRMSLYRTVLAEGLRQDVVTYLNRDLLLDQWPVLRTLISRPLREVWEARFPELTDRAAAAA
ncbi:hypothetical protein [Streptomyces hesseae]|uniref:hypothetical protein n=1 Tax=Streptomyces hesseae TaxID=3075519 RepID=UPI003F68B52D